MPTITIDGQSLDVENGTTILQAARSLGIDIPTFCYHPGLSVPANCRMCLVALEGPPDRPPPKPVPACHTAVWDGMTILTNDERATRMRESVLEFILVNHPIDCPICDQAGECVLQDHYFRYSVKESRLNNTKKVPKPKLKVFGPDVVYDAERCILCTRCARFCTEIAKQTQLKVIHRGEHAEISTFPGEELDNPYAGNVVDLCPVGALTSRDFRFKNRVWFMQSADSVCPECSRGCRIRIDTFENTPRRYKPNDNPKVNGWWICDEGRVSYAKYLEGRQVAPRVGGDIVPLDEALGAAVSKVKAAGSGLGVVVSPWFTNEDAFLVGQLLKGPLAKATVYLGGRAEGEGDEVLRQTDKNPNRRGVEEVFGALGVAAKPLAELSVEGLKGLVVFGDNHSAAHEQLATIGQVPERIVLGAMKSDAVNKATVFLPTRLHWEKDGTFVNCDGIVQRIYRAVRAVGTTKSDGWYAMQLAAGLGAPLEPYQTSAAVFAALAEAVPGFAGMTHTNLAPHGVELGGAAVEQSAAEDGAEEAD